MGSGTLISHPLPLVQPQDEFYDQASPDKRTEADGNSDPNSGELKDIFPYIWEHLIWHEMSGVTATQVDVNKAR